MQIICSPICEVSQGRYQINRYQIIKVHPSSETLNDQAACSPGVHLPGLTPRRVQCCTLQSLHWGKYIMAHKLEYIFKHCTYLRLFYNICNNPKLELICQEAHKHGLSYVSAGVAGRCQGGSGQRRECQCSHSKATVWTPQLVPAPAQYLHT